MRDLKLVGQQTCTWCWLEHSRERHLLFRRSDRAVLAYFCDLDCYFSESRCDAGTGRLCRALVLQPYTCEEHFPSRVLISVFCFFPSKRNECLSRPCVIYRPAITYADQVFGNERPKTITEERAEKGEPCPSHAHPMPMPMPRASLNTGIDDLLRYLSDAVIDD